MNLHRRTRITLAGGHIGGVLGEAAARLVRAGKNPQFVAWLNGSAAVAEVVLFLPVSILVVAIVHAAVGPAATLTGLVVTYTLAHRPSFRALAWIAGGLYVSWALLNAGSALAVQPADPLGDPARSLVTLALSAGGLGACLLTFGLPAVRAAARWFPEQSAMVTIWVMELGKGGLAGASIGAGLASLLTPEGPLAVGDSPGRVLVIGLATTVGLVAGGLRADGRVRLASRARPSVGQES